MISCNIRNIATSFPIDSSLSLEMPSMDTRYNVVSLSICPINMARPSLDVCYALSLTIVRLLVGPSHRVLSLSAHLPQTLSPFHNIITINHTCLSHNLVHFHRLLLEASSSQERSQLSCFGVRQNRYRCVVGESKHSDKANNKVDIHFSLDRLLL